MEKITAKIEIDQNKLFEKNENEIKELITKSLNDSIIKKINEFINKIENFNLFIEPDSQKLIGKTEIYIVEVDSLQKQIKKIFEFGSKININASTIGEMCLILTEEPNNKPIKEKTNELTDEETENIANVIEEALSTNPF